MRSFSSSIFRQRARYFCFKLDIICEVKSPAHIHNWARFPFTLLGANRAQFLFLALGCRSHSGANRARIGRYRARWTRWLQIFRGDSSSIRQWKTREIPVLVNSFKNKWNYCRKSTFLAHFCSYTELPSHVKNSGNPIFLFWSWFLSGFKAPMKFKDNFLFLFYPFLASI